MNVFSPLACPVTLRLNYPLERPRHPLTPELIREWYTIHRPSGSFIAWREDSKVGFRLGIDELCWREEDVRGWHLLSVRPAKGWGSIALHVQSHNSVTSWAVLIEPFTEVGLQWTQQLGAWLEGCGFALILSDYGTDS